MIKDLKTPLRYPGGKSRATKTILSEERLPDVEFHDIHEYREMFLGGGSCAFYFSQLRPDVPVWVNDKYTPLYHFWKVLQEDGVRLMHTLKECKERLGTDIEAHRKVFLDAKETLQEDDDPFNLATGFYRATRCRSVVCLNRLRSASKHHNRTLLYGVSRNCQGTRNSWRTGRSQTKTTLPCWRVRIRTRSSLLIHPTTSSLSSMERTVTCTRHLITRSSTTMIDRTMPWS